MLLRFLRATLSSLSIFKVLKNVDMVVKTEPLKALPLAATKRVPGRPLLVPELRLATATVNPAVKATSNGFKVAIPKNASSTRNV